MKSACSLCWIASERGSAMRATADRWEHCHVWHYVTGADRSGRQGTSHFTIFGVPSTLNLNFGPQLRTWNFCR
jgi:hypothetical protein